MVVHFISLSTLVFVHMCKNYNVILVDFSFDECAVPFPIPISFGLKSILSDIKIRYYFLGPFALNIFFFLLLPWGVSVLDFMLCSRRIYPVSTSILFICLLYCRSESIDFESYHYLFIPVSFFSGFSSHLLICWLDIMTLWSLL